MANRQHGGRPSGRSPASRGRTVSVSRSPANSRGSAGGWSETWTSGTPVYTEPEVRRWPHPLEDAIPDAAPDAAPEPALHYIRCALSYQNQLLADIKVLLEQLAAAPAAEIPASHEPSQEKG